MELETYGNDLSDWNWGPPLLCEVLEKEDRERCGARQEHWRAMWGSGRAVAKSAS